MFSCKYKVKKPSDIMSELGCTPARQLSFFIHENNDYSRENGTIDGHSFMVKTQTDIDYDYGQDYILAIEKTEDNVRGYVYDGFKMIPLQVDGIYEFGTEHSIDYFKTLFAEQIQLFHQFAFKAKGTEFSCVESKCYFCGDEKFTMPINMYTTNQGRFEDICAESLGLNNDAPELPYSPKKLWDIYNEKDTYWKKHPFFYQWTDDFTEKTRNSNVPSICPYCNGYGIIMGNPNMEFVSRDMAMDAGDLSMEGMSLSSDSGEEYCSKCSASGIQI